MPRPRSLKPKHCHHKASGQGYVRIAGRAIYTGPWASQESKDEYDRVIGEWIASGRQRGAGASLQSNALSVDPTVAVILAAFLSHAERYYAPPDGTTSYELRNFKQACRPLRRLFGATSAGQFGPNRMRVVRDEMIKAGWCRTRINREMARIRMIFKWAVRQELLPATVIHALRAVEPLRLGRTDARESMPVPAVDESHVSSTLPFLSPIVSSMVKIQLLTGMRSGEIVAMRACDIDTTGEIWLYSPPKHKTAHHGHKRRILIGPKAQAILWPLLKTDLRAFIFSPSDAEAERRETLRAKRRTPANRGNVPGSNKKAVPARTPGVAYDIGAYRRAIARACDKAFPPSPDLTPAELAKWRSDHRWHPHQLRHTAATAIRRQFGLEAAQVVLGHATLSATQIYAEKNVAAAAAVMKQIG
jgi:integrase